MVSADEHFERTMEDFRTLARTQSLVDDDLELMDFSEEDKVYVRLFVFSLFSSFFFFLLARALRKRRNKNNTRAKSKLFFLSRSSIADAFLFVSPSLLGAQAYGAKVSESLHCA